jgi:hypothetical protein
VFVISRLAPEPHKSVQGSFWQLSKCPTPMVALQDPAENKRRPKPPFEWLPRYRNQADLRRREKPSPAKAAPSNARVAGSGTAT